MVAWKYEIFPLVLKKIFFNTRREISYLRTAMYDSNNRVISGIVAKSVVAVTKMFKKLKHIKTYLNRRIASETRAQRKLFPLLITSVLRIKK